MSLTTWVDERINAAITALMTPENLAHIADAVSAELKQALTEEVATLTGHLDERIDNIVNKVDQDFDGIVDKIFERLPHFPAIPGLPGFLGGT